jgi:hypothetical protein
VLQLLRQRVPIRLRNAQVGDALLHGWVYAGSLLLHLLLVWILLGKDEKPRSQDLNRAPLTAIACDGYIKAK